MAVRENLNAHRLVNRMRHGRQAEQRESDEQERAVATALGAEARRKAGRQAEPEMSAEALAPWLEMFERATGRPMSLERRQRDRRLHVIQRCRACGAEIEARLPGGVANTPEWMVDVGAIVRNAYQVHRCAPVEVEVTGMSIEHVDILMRELEVDMLRAGERLRALQALVAIPEVRRG